MFPRFLFLFRTPPIPIPLSELHRWQKLLSDFLWDYKHHRIAFNKLSRPLKFRGFNIPNLEWYYDAAQLVQALKLLGNLSNVLDSWSDLESYYVKPSTLCVTLWSDPRDRVLTYKDNFMLCQTVAVWDKWSGRLAPRPSLLQPFSSTSSAFPVLPANIKMKFAAANLYTVGDLFLRKMFLTRTALEDIIQAPLSWFIYFQLNSFANGASIKAALERSKTSFESLLLSSGGKARHALSFLYQLLSAEECSSAHRDYAK